MKIDRLLSIIIHLLNQEKVSARALAEKYGVTIRTIQRDMETIDLAGIPIQSLQGANGGYAIMDNFKMDKQLVSVEDLYYIVTALKSVAETLQDEQMDGTLEKVKTLFPNHHSEFLAERNDKLSIDFSMLGGDPRRQSSFKQVKEAVDKERLLQFTYTNNRLERIIRVVEPMTIAFRWRGWYLFAWCRERADFRLFRISKIKDAQVLPTHFKRKKGCLDDFFRSPQNLKQNQTIKLKFEASIRSLVEEFFPPEDSEIGPDGALTVKTNLPEDSWVYGYILSFGDKVTLLEPLHLKEKICTIAMSIVEKYTTH